MGWAGWNQRTDEGNRQAIANAQAVQNQWLAQVAQSREAAQARDFQAQQQADAQVRESAANQKKFAENVREFDVSTKQGDAKLAADELASKRAYDWQQGQRTNALDSIANLGTAMQPQIDEAAQARDKAQSDYEEADSSFTKLRTTLEKSLPGHWDKGRGEFVVNSSVPVAEKDKANADIQKANEELASGKAEHAAALLAYQTHNAHVDALTGQLGKDLSVVKKGGSYLLYSHAHPNGGMWFGKETPVKAEAPPTVTAPAALPPPVAPAPAPSSFWNRLGSGAVSAAITGLSPILGASQFFRSGSSGTQPVAQPQSAPIPQPPPQPAPGPVQGPPSPSPDRTFNQAWPGFGGASVPQPQPAPQPPPQPAPVADAIPPAPNDRHSETLVPGKTYLVYGKPMQWDGQQYVGKGFMGSTTKTGYGPDGYLRRPPGIPSSEISQHWDPKAGGEGFQNVDRYDEAPVNPRQRIYGKVYLTPKGPAQWVGGPDGEGWLPAT